MVRLCGATLGLFAFSVTIFLGLLVGNSLEETVWRALSAMFTFCGLGMIAGWVCNRVLDEYAIQRRMELFGDERGTEAGTTVDAVSEDQGPTELTPVGS